MTDNGELLIIFANMKQQYQQHILLLALLLLTLPIPAQHRSQKGKATYYSRKATGARTADGGRLHHDSLTCAHRTLPFGTLLKVTNLRNQKSIIVKVTDRGPYRRGCIIDLSYGAAAQLGMLAQGLAMVEVQRVSGNNPPYRLDDTETGMPDFEFDFSKARYNFIKEWNAKADEEHELEGKRLAARKQQAAKRLAEIKEAKVAKEEKKEEEQNQTANQHVKERQQMMAAHHPGMPNNQKKTSTHPQTGTKKQDPSIWRSVFQKVKNWFGD